MRPYLQLLPTHWRSYNKQVHPRPRVRQPRQQWGREQWVSLQRIWSVLKWDGVTQPVDRVQQQSVQRHWISVRISSADGLAARGRKLSSSAAADSNSGKSLESKHTYWHGIYPWASIRSPDLVWKRFRKSHGLSAESRCDGRRISWILSFWGSWGQPSLITRRSEVGLFLWNAWKPYCNGLYVRRSEECFEAEQEWLWDCLWIPPELGQPGSWSAVLEWLQQLEQ